MNKVEHQYTEIARWHIDHKTKELDNCSIPMRRYAEYRINYCINCPFYKGEFSCITTPNKYFKFKDVDELATQFLSMRVDIDIEHYLETLS